MNFNTTVTNSVFIPMNILGINMEGGMESEPAMSMPQDEASASIEQVMEQVVMMFTEGLEKQDCNMLMEGASMFLASIQGGEAPMEETPMEGMKQEATV